jgi:outer membrane protein assembly factor BamB
VYLSNGLLLEAFDAETGEPLWDHELGANRTGPLAIADGRLYLGNSDGHVYAFENSESLAEPRTEIGKYVWPALGICGMSGVLAVLVAGAIVLSVRSRRE